MPRRRISGPTRAWLGALPQTAVIDGMTLVHGSPRDPLREYVVSGAVARANLAAMSTDVGLHGHTHVPIVFAMTDDGIASASPEPGDSIGLADHRMLLNPGSVGQPRDGDPRASYLVLDRETGQASWHRVAYDVPSVQAAIRARLAARHVTHIYVHWGEIARYRSPGNYGFPEFITRDLFARLVAEGVLSGPLPAIEGHLGEVYRVETRPAEN